LKKTTTLFLLLAALFLATRLCHTGILWEGDTLPLAAAQQMVAGKVIYRDVWFDKPPLTPTFYLLATAQPGWPLRLLDALYCLLACWIAWRFARDLWSEREAWWAAALLTFFLIFDIPSSVIPVASDLMILAPHLAAVWLAWKRKALWSGAMAAIAVWISPKGLLVAAVCVAWNPAGLVLFAAGFGSVSAVAVGYLWATGALGAYWEEVWKWGRLYAESTFIAHPMRNGLLRTLNWLGFHAAAVIAAIWFWRGKSEGPGRAAWAVWLVVALAGAAAGMRFFPRYYLMLLAPVLLMAARGFVLLGRKAVFVATLLLVPAVRFGPSYVAAATNAQWRDTGMDRESRAAAAQVRRLAKPGDTLFVWGYRPEMFPYTSLPAATMYLDSQPLTGVPADRHLTQSTPVETGAPARRRAELAHSRPTFIVDGLSLFNPDLALSKYPELREWFSRYQEVGRAGGTIIFRHAR
jgi:hypothetical protein